MKEHPILFSAPMVRAILDGRKTQTRRIVRLQPDVQQVTVRGEFAFALNSHGAEIILCRCPYGQAGDRLWVRETWRIGAWDESRAAFALDYCDGPRKQWVDVPDPDCDGGELFNHLWQQSTDDAIKAGLKTDEHGNYKWEPGQSPCRWRPSIHMPRWASRITLEITGVRVERLQDISEPDAKSEGADNINGEYAEGFAVLWESINGPGSWDANPWVWVVEFRNVSK